MLVKMSTPARPSSSRARSYSSIITSSTTGMTPTPMNRDGWRLAKAAMLSLATRTMRCSAPRSMPSHTGGRASTSTWTSKPCSSMKSMRLSASWMYGLCERSACELGGGAHLREGVDERHREHVRVGVDDHTAPPVSSLSASAFFDTLPNGDSGKSSSTSRRSGSLNLAMPRPSRKAVSSSSVRLCPGRRMHARAHALAEHRVRVRHAGGVAHRGVHEDEVLHLLGADLLAAAVDEVLDAPLDQVRAGRVAAHQVAGAVEAVRRELALRCTPARGSSRAACTARAR